MESISQMILAPVYGDSHSFWGAAQTISGGEAELVALDTVSPNSTPMKPPVTPHSCSLRQAALLSACLSSVPSILHTGEGWENHLLPLEEHAELHGKINSDQSEPHFGTAAWSHVSLGKLFPLSMTCLFFHTSTRAPASMHPWEH